MKRRNFFKNFAGLTALVTAPAALFGKKEKAAEVVAKSVDPVIIDASLLPEGISLQEALDYYHKTGLLVYDTSNAQGDYSLHHVKAESGSGRDMQIYTQDDPSPIAEKMIQSSIDAIRKEEFQKSLRESKQRRSMSRLDPYVHINDVSFPGGRSFRVGDYCIHKDNKNKAMCSDIKYRIDGGGNHQFHIEFKILSRGVRDMKTITPPPPVRETFFVTNETPHIKIPYSLINARNYE